MGRRVFITGLGAITPVGMNIKSTFKNICSGVSGLKKLEKNEFYDFKCNVGGPLPDEAYSA